MRMLVININKSINFTYNSLKFFWPIFLNGSIDSIDKIRWKKVENINDSAYVSKALYGLHSYE